MLTHRPINWLAAAKRSATLIKKINLLLIFRKTGNRKKVININNEPINEKEDDTFVTN
jgi:hypothetical protein